MTIGVLPVLTDLTILVIVVPLSLKLAVALVFDLVKGPRVELMLLFNVFLDCQESLFCFVCRLNELFFCFLLLAFSHLHGLLKIDVALPCPLKLFVGNHLDMFFNSLLIFLVALLSEFVQVVVMIYRILTPFFALLIDRGKLFNSIEFLLLHKFLVALRI